MLIEIYLALMLIATIFTIISFVQYSVASVSDVIRFNIFMPYMAAVIFLSLSVQSTQIQYQHCDTPVDTVDTQSNLEKYDYNVTDNLNKTVTGAKSKFQYPFSCTTYAVEQVGPVYLFGGLGLLMLVFALVNTIELLPVTLGRPG